MFDQVLNKTGGDLVGNDLGPKHVGNFPKIKPSQKFLNLQYLQIFFLNNLVTCFSTELYNNNISI